MNFYSILNFLEGEYDMKLEKCGKLGELWECGEFGKRGEYGE